jgi:hypothetical protein
VALSFVLISCNNQAKNIENKEVAKDTSEYDILKTAFSCILFYTLCNYSQKR